MGLPVWVKPARLGSSVGISKVTSLEGGLDDAVELARRHDPRVIVEAHGGGREVECSVLGDEAPRTSPPGEIVAHADWYDYEAKYSEGGMELMVPAPIGEAETARVRELAARAFRAIDGSGLARCDFFVRDSGEVLVNELNTIPGFTATSMFAKLFEADGLSIRSSATSWSGWAWSATRSSAASSSEPAGAVSRAHLARPLTAGRFRRHRRNSPRR